MFRNNLEYHNTELECSNYQSFVRRGLISRGDFLFRFNVTVIACYVLFLRHHGMGIRDGENYTKLQTPNLFVVVNGVVYFFITECHNSENYRMPWDSFSTTHSGEVTSRQWRLVRGAEESTLLCMLDTHVQTKVYERWNWHRFFMKMLSKNLMYVDFYTRIRYFIRIQFNRE